MNKKINSIISIFVGITVILVGSVLPAFAQTVDNAGISTNVSVTASTTGVSTQTQIDAVLSAKIKNITERADQEITRRVQALDALNVKISNMNKLSVVEKRSLLPDIQTQLTEMATLKSQINTDAAQNNTSSLKLDVQSITRTYRIFALILPQGMIEAGSDRVLTVVGIMSDLGTKLSSRISVAQSAGNNVSVSETAIADFNARVSDANTQATAASREVSTLSPDGGNAPIMASNTASLKDARSKISASQKDLIAARADAQTIIKDLKINVSTTASASSSAN